MHEKYWNMKTHESSCQLRNHHGETVLERKLERKKRKIPYSTHLKWILELEAAKMWKPTNLDDRASTSIDESRGGCLSHPEYGRELNNYRIPSIVASQSRRENRISSISRRANERKSFRHVISYPRNRSATPISTHRIILPSKYARYREISCRDLPSVFERFERISTRLDERETLTRNGRGTKNVPPACNFQPRRLVSGKQSSLRVPRDKFGQMRGNSQRFAQMDRRVNSESRDRIFRSRVWLGGDDAGSEKCKFQRMIFG